jgi:sugar phosphate isomerase/epimerase
MIGVSPAFMVSLYGPGFSIGNFCEGLKLVRKLGFSAYQPEILVGTALTEWAQDARSVHRTASDLGLVPTQFVAHFILEEFSNPEKLNPRSGIGELHQVLDIVQGFPPCRVLTIPASTFGVDWNSPEATDFRWWQAVHQRLAEKIGRYVEVVAEAGMKLAFEILPFSVIGGIGRFVNLCNEIGSPALGINFDTGHAWACRELVPLLPFELWATTWALKISSWRRGKARSRGNPCWRTWPAPAMTGAGISKSAVGPIRLSNSTGLD